MSEPERWYKRIYSFVFFLSSLSNYFCALKLWHYRKAYKECIKRTMKQRKNKSQKEPVIGLQLNQI